MMLQRTTRRCHRRHRDRAARTGDDALAAAVVANAQGFGIRRVLLQHMRRGRVFAIGDTAHEVSPIGGQGMTLGLLDALALAPLLSRALSGTTNQIETEKSFASWSGVRLKAAQRAARQAHLNMRLGRPLDQRLVGSRDALVRGLLASKGFERAVASTFTMVNHEVRR